MGGKKTSSTDPIRVDFIPPELHGFPGQLGMTFAPGKIEYGTTAHWERSPDLDLLRLRDEYKTRLLVTLLEEYEMDELNIPSLITSIELHGIRARWYPFPDGFVPPDMQSLDLLTAEIVAALRTGLTVVVHGRSGLRRTPLILACALIRCGVPADKALAASVACREGCEMTQLAKAFIRRYEEHCEKKKTAPGT